MHFKKIKKYINLRNADFLQNVQFTITFQLKL